MSQPVSALSLSNASTDLELPSYHQVSQGRRTTNAHPQVEHAYHLTKGGRRWLSLHLRSRAEHPGQQPSFIQSQLITGSVSLDLRNEVLIRSISVHVIGELSADAHRFLTITRQLHVSDLNEVSSDTPEQPVVHAGKLVGKHTWPFTIRMPRGVCIVPNDGTRHMFRLPPSLDGKARIRYHILVRVKRGTLSSGQRLVVPFTYTPQARPAQPSILRQIAYLENSPLAGPDGDPDGWRTSQPVKICGKIFNARSIEVTCTLSIARPLCYTRGTAIPLTMTISSSDSQALDLLSSPIAPSVRLLRLAEFSPTILSSATKVVGPWEAKPEIVGDAVWWLVPDVSGAAAEETSRCLHGEIKIPEDAPPNCRILNFQLQYAVALFPFKAVAFTPAVLHTSQLHSENVEIVTVHAQGPRPVAYLPPQYDATL